MRRYLIAVVLLTAATSAFAAEVSIPFGNGAIQAQLDAADRGRGVVILVPGTGVFDRDVRFGRSGGAGDLVFKDLAGRLNAAGVATLRFDAPGVIYGQAGTPDRAQLSRRTTTSMRDEVGAIYSWLQSKAGVRAGCIAFVTHSEGVLHVARLAASGAPAPGGVFAVGAPMGSPKDGVIWQMTERDAASIEAMDANGDGVVSNDEVRAGWTKTRSSVFGMLEPLLNAKGGWTAQDVQALKARQAALYETQRTAALSHADSEPFPSADRAVGSYQWWKSFFLDEAETATRLKSWKTRFKLYYGERDSQLVPDVQRKIAERTLGEGVKSTTYSDVGHTLGTEVLMGPMRADIADQIAVDVAEAVGRCR